MPKFVLKEMESLYIEELKSSINLLMANLESLPVSKGGADSKYGLHKIKRYNHRSVPGNMHFGNPLSLNIDISLKNVRADLSTSMKPRLLACYQNIFNDLNDIFVSNKLGL